VLFTSTTEYFKQRICITNMMSQHLMLGRLLSSVDTVGTIHISRDVLCYETKVNYHELIEINYRNYLFVTVYTIKINKTNLSCEVC